MFFLIILLTSSLVVMAAAAILLAGFSRRVERQSETGPRIEYRPGMGTVFIASVVLIVSARFWLLWWLTVGSSAGYEGIFLILACFPEALLLELLAGPVVPKSSFQINLTIVLTSLLWVAGFTGLTAGLRKLRRG